MRSECDLDLSTVVEVVVNQVPAHPLAGDHFRLAVILPRLSLLSVFHHPMVDCIFIQKWQSDRADIY